MCIGLRSDRFIAVVVYHMEYTFIKKNNRDSIHHVFEYVSFCCFRNNIFYVVTQNMKAYENMLQIDTLHHVAYALHNI